MLQINIKIREQQRVIFKQTPILLNKKVVRNYLLINILVISIELQGVIDTRNLNKI